MTPAGVGDVWAVRRLTQRQVWALRECVQFGGTVTVPPQQSRQEYARLLVSSSRSRRVAQDVALATGGVFVTQVVLTLVGLGSSWLVTVLASLVLVGLVTMLCSGLVAVRALVRASLFRARHDRMEIEARYPEAANRASCTVFSARGDGTRSFRFPSVTPDGGLVDVSEMTRHLVVLADGERGEALGRVLELADPDGDMPEAWRLAVARVAALRQRALLLWDQAYGRVRGLSPWSENRRTLERDTREVVLLAFGDELRELGYSVDSPEWEAVGAYFSARERLPVMPPRSHVFDLDAWVSPGSRCRYGHVGEFVVSGTRDSAVDGRAGRVCLECVAPVGDPVAGSVCGARWTERTLD